MKRFHAHRLAALVAGASTVFVGDIVVDTALDSHVLSHAAEAQGRGGRGGGMRGMGGMREIRELLEPDFSRRDMPLFVEQLRLDDGQRAIIEALLEDYSDSFGEGSEMVQADLTDLGRSMMQSFMSGGAMGDMRERMRERFEGIRAEIEEMEANGEPMSEEERRDFFRGRMEGMQQEMMDEAMDSGAFDEVRGALTEMLDILERWIAEREKLGDTFTADVEIQLDDDQLVLWPAFDRFLTREKSLPRGRLSGEDINLFAVIDDIALDDESFDALESMLDEYELALHTVLEARDDYLLKSAPKLFRAMRDGDVDAAERILKQQVRLRESVRDTNDRFRQMFVDALEDQQAKSSLDLAFLEEAYERIYSPTWAHRCFDEAVELPDLDPETLEAVVQLQTAFLQEMGNRNRTLMAELRKVEGDRQVDEGTRMVAVMAGDLSRGLPWGPGSRRGGGDEDDRYREGMDERNEAGDRYVEQLRAMLTPAQQEALPERRGRGGRGGGWGGGRDNDERRQEMIKRFDANGDGELNEEERRKMFESFRGGGGGRGGEGGRGGRGGEGGPGGRGGRGGPGGVG